MTLDWRSRLRLTTLSANRGALQRSLAPTEIRHPSLWPRSTQSRPPRNATHQHFQPQTHVHGRSSLSPHLTFSYFTSLLDTITVATQNIYFDPAGAKHRELKCGGADSSALLRPERLAPATRPVIAVAARECIAVNCDKHCEC
jgi:hypothetical protein